MGQNDTSTTDPGRKSEPAHILIIEDDPRVANTVRDILETFRGDLCTVIRSKRVAEERVRRQRPDLMILDYKLLGGTGCVLVRLASNMRIPAIVISGHNVGEKVEELGFPFLEKPFTADQLLKLVSTHLIKKMI
jgi:DNA-binding NtrC family response regulator